MTRAVLAHRAGALLWALALIPALLWWRESVLFVIVASVYANVAAGLSAAEAADDRRVLDRLDQLAELLTRSPPGGTTVDNITPAPTLGRIVLYRLTEEDADAINRRRLDAAAYTHRFASAQCGPGGLGRTGHVAHVGNAARPGDQYPAVVVRVWAGGHTVESYGSVNLQVLLDGTDTLWATSVTEGDQPRQWAWPPRD